MFAASVVFCAVVNGNVVTDRCVALRDMYGPYITIEQCFERAQEMVDVVESTPIINMGLFAQLGFPDTMMSNQMCDKTEEQAV